MSDVENNPAESTPLESLLQATESFYKRTIESSRPLTQGALSNFVVNDLVPLVKALKAEYDEGFAAVEEQLDAPPGDEDVATAVVEKSKEVVGQIALYMTALLRQLAWADEQGQPVAAMPDTMREAYETIQGSLHEWKDLVEDFEEGADEEDDADGENAGEGGEA